MTPCSFADCTSPAAARVVAPDHGSGPLFAIVRPVSSTVGMGQDVCCEHAHVMVDVVLMRARPPR